MSQKMKSQKVETAAGDEEFVRLDIFDGRIPLGEAGDRLLELALAHHARSQNTNSFLLHHMRENAAALSRIADALERQKPSKFATWWQSIRKRVGRVKP